jgi:hypothetical protein
MCLCIDSKTQKKYVCILSIERSRVSLNFNLNSKYKAEGLRSQPTRKINKNVCVL